MQHITKMLLIRKGLLVLTSPTKCKSAQPAELFKIQCLGIMEHTIICMLSCCACQSSSFAIQVNPSPYLAWHYLSLRRGLFSISYSSDIITYYHIAVA